MSKAVYDAYIAEGDSEWPEVSSGTYSTGFGCDPGHALRTVKFCCPDRYSGVAGFNC